MFSSIHDKYVNILVQLHNIRDERSGGKTHHKYYIII